MIDWRAENRQSVCNRSDVTQVFFFKTCVKCLCESPEPKEVRQIKSSMKSMLIYFFVCFFFYNKGIVHKEFVIPGQTVNSVYYVEVLRHL